MGQEAQRRGIVLKFGLMGLESFSIEGLDAPDVGKMSPGDVVNALNEGLQAARDILSDPDEELTIRERKLFSDGISALQEALKVV